MWSFAYFAKNESRSEGKHTSHSSLRKGANSNYGDLKTNLPSGTPSSPTLLEYKTGTNVVKEYCASGLLEFKR